MGIKNFTKLLTEFMDFDIITIDMLSNKKIAIDANLFIYKSILAIKKNIQKDHIDYNIIHIISILNKLIALKKFNIITIFVFDSSYDSIKENTILLRKSIRKNILFKSGFDCHISNEQFCDIITLIELFGFDVFFAKVEADAQCAYFNKYNIVDYVVSDDSDILLFGSNNIIKNFSLSSQKKNKKDKEMFILYTSKIINCLNITFNSLIDLAILLGTDYIHTIKNIGMKKAFYLIKNFSSITNIIKAGYIPNNYNFLHVRNYYLNPPIIKINNKTFILNNKKINLNALHDFLMIKKSLINNLTIQNIYNKIFHIFK